MSSNITSHFDFAICARASCPLRASAKIAPAKGPERICFRPSRTMVWSSTIRIRSGAGEALLRSIMKEQLDHHGSVSQAPWPAQPELLLLRLFPCPFDRGSPLYLPGRQRAPAFPKGRGNLFLKVLQA